MGSRPRPAARPARPRPLEVSARECSRIDPEFQRGTRGHSCASPAAPSVDDVWDAADGLRICLVYDCLFPYTVGGAERWYRNLAERLPLHSPDVSYPTARPRE